MKLENALLKNAVEKPKIETMADRLYKKLLEIHKRLEDIKRRNT